MAPLVYNPITYYCPWSRLNISEFESLLLQSPLCAPSSWESADQLAELFDSCVNNSLNQLIPMRTAKIRKRPSGLWFVDDLRRKTKGTTRRLERCLRLLRRHTSSESSSVEVTILF